MSLFIIGFVSGFFAGLAFMIWLVNKNIGPRW